MKHACLRSRCMYQRLRKLYEMAEKHQANNSLPRLERQDSEVSPGTILPKPQPTNARSYIAPWEQDSPSTQFSKYGGEQLLQGSGKIPSIKQQPPSASPWSMNDEKTPQMPSSIFSGSFYNDSNENVAQISPGFAPPGGMGFAEGDDRRPSIASATTVSSTGSKSSLGGRFHKKLQGFFGDEFQGPANDGSRQNSETSSIQGGQLPAFAPGGSTRNRNNSLNDMMRSGPPSPTSSRPRTPAPAPSSEVTPWVYQDDQVSHGRGRTFPCVAGRVR